MLDRDRQIRLVLCPLIELHHERAAEEAAGDVRYLRPEYQNPQGAQQAALDIKTAPKKKRPARVSRSSPGRRRSRPRLRPCSVRSRPRAARPRPHVAKRFKRVRLDQV